MYDVIKQIFDICLFKKGPADLPSSLTLQTILVIVYAIIRVLMANGVVGWQQSMLQVIVEILYIGGYSWVMLFLIRRPQRARQVTSAFYGTYALIGFIALPATLSMGIGRGGWLVVFTMIAIMSWFCAVTAHIVYHALDRRLNASIGATLLYLMGFYLILDALFPGSFPIYH